MYLSFNVLTNIMVSPYHTSLYSWIIISFAFMQVLSVFIYEKDSLWICGFKYYLK